MDAAAREQSHIGGLGNVQISLAGTLAMIADRNGDSRTLDEAWRLASWAGAFVRQANPPLIPWSDSVASDIQDVVARHKWSLPPISGPAL